MLPGEFYGGVTMRIFSFNELYEFGRREVQKYEQHLAHETRYTIRQAIDKANGERELASGLLNECKDFEAFDAKFTRWQKNGYSGCYSLETLEANYMLYKAFRVSATRSMNFIMEVFSLSHGMLSGGAVLFKHKNGVQEWIQIGLSITEIQELMDFVANNANPEELKALFGYSLFENYLIRLCLHGQPIPADLLKKFKIPEIQSLFDDIINTMLDGERDKPFIEKFKSLIEILKTITDATKSTNSFQLSEIIQQKILEMIRSLRPEDPLYCNFEAFYKAHFHHPIILTFYVSEHLKKGSPEKYPRDLSLTAPLTSTMLLDFLLKPGLAIPSELVKVLGTSYKDQIVAEILAKSSETRYLIYQAIFNQSDKSALYSVLNKRRGMVQLGEAASLRKLRDDFRALNTPVLGIAVEVKNTKKEEDLFDNVVVLASSSEEEKIDPKETLRRDINKALTDLDSAVYAQHVNFTLRAAKKAVLNAALAYLDSNRNPADIDKFLYVRDRNSEYSVSTLPGVEAVTLRLAKELVGLSPELRIAMENRQAKIRAQGEAEFKRDMPTRRSSGSGLFGLTSIPNIPDDEPCDDNREKRREESPAI